MICQLPIYILKKIMKLRKNSSFNWFTPVHVLIRPDVIWKKISRPLYHVHFTVIHTNSRHKRKYNIPAAVIRFKIILKCGLYIEQHLMTNDAMVGPAIQIQIRLKLIFTVPHSIAIIWFRYLCTTRQHVSCAKYVAASSSDFSIGVT